MQRICSDGETLNVLVCEICFFFQNFNSGVRARVRLLRHGGAIRGVQVILFYYLIIIFIKLSIQDATGRDADAGGQSVQTARVPGECVGRVKHGCAWTRD